MKMPFREKRANLAVHFLDGKIVRKFLVFVQPHLAHTYAYRIY